MGSIAEPTLQVLYKKSRLIYKPLSVTQRVCRSTTSGVTVISLGRTLPNGSCSLPETREKTGRFPTSEKVIVSAWPCSNRGLPGRGITANAGGLLHHLFTLTLAGGLFLWPDPADCSAPGVTRRFALWSADFPRSPKAPRPSDQPGLSVYPQDRPASMRGILPSGR